MARLALLGRILNSIQTTPCVSSAGRTGRYARRVPAVTTSARGDARRKQILEGALAAIRAQPIADVQLASIAEQAGMKPNHILYYFPSRDAVLIAAVAYAEHA